VEWDATALLAAVLAHEEGRLLVAPVTAEDPQDPTDAVAVASGESPTGAPVFVWGALRSEVPLGVFLRPAGALPAAVLRQTSAMAPPSTPNWTAAVQRAQLAAALDGLAQATWTPEAADLEIDVPLADLLRARKLRPVAVAELTGITMSALTDILREDRQATSEEAARLAAALGVEASTVRRAVAIPAALVRVLERPVHRLGIRTRALTARVSEAATRLAVAEALVATPARTTRSERDVETWDQLIRHHLDG
jgi:transcriptional regulator with XRE-family HTH domain